MEGIATYGIYGGAFSKQGLGGTKTALFLIRFTININTRAVFLKGVTPIFQSTVGCKTWRDMLQRGEETKGRSAKGARCK